MSECYVRGSTIKYMRIPDEVIDMVKEEAVVKSRGGNSSRGGKGGFKSRNQRGGLYNIIDIFV